MEKKIAIQSNNERVRGKGDYVQRIMRITGFLTGDITKWGTAKRAELVDRVTHT